MGTIAEPVKELLEEKALVSSQEPMCCLETGDLHCLIEKSEAEEARIVCSPCRHKLMA